MSSLELFPREQVVGVFRGFREGGLEFHADIALPYRSEFHSVPMHGQFILVQLETEDEAVLGRITFLASEGKLSSPSGENFSWRAMHDNREVPEDLREQYLKYRVNVRVLGVLRRNGPGLTFVPSHRRLPHVGSAVAFPSGDVLRELAGHDDEGAALGHFALGEYVYAAGSSSLLSEGWVQVEAPEIMPKFTVLNLVARRTFIFARAGFGKSNLNKLLFSTLYSTTPKVAKRGGREAPVGTVLFDPDGEYFWPDDRGRPGLCDVLALQDQLVVFTSRKAPSAYYQSYVAGGIRLDIRRLSPSDVIAIALDPERQDQQNVRKLRSLGQAKWAQLVDLVDAEGYEADLKTVAGFLQLQLPNQEAEALAARANMVTVVRMLHDRSSQLMDMLLEALSQGKLCVVDLSQMRGSQSMVLSGLILRRIFDRNQKEFTAATPQTIPTIAVIEEAQAVLQEGRTSTEPFVSWVKEGRKYDLGAVLITQQPGSIPGEILSQGDNWFVFHLLSAADLTTLKRANGHFSDDLLSVLLNEPIPGHGLFWSSVSGRPYPLSIRALSFEHLYTARDPTYSGGPVDAYASTLRERYALSVADAQGAITHPAPEPAEPRTPVGTAVTADGEALVDVLGAYEQAAIDGLRARAELRSKVSGEGIAYGRVKFLLRDLLPESLDDREEVAYNLVPRALDAILGDGGWHTEKDARGKTVVKGGDER